MRPCVHGTYTYAHITSQVFVNFFFLCVGSTVAHPHPHSHRSTSSILILLLRFPFSLFWTGIKYLCNFYIRPKYVWLRPVEWHQRSRRMLVDFIAGTSNGPTVWEWICARMPFSFFLVLIYGANLYLHMFGGCAGHEHTYNAHCMPSSSPKSENSTSHFGFIFFFLLPFLWLVLGSSLHARRGTYSSLCSIRYTR